MNNMEKKILVVEDNDNNMLLIKYILENTGFAVIEAKTGGEGIARAHEMQADLIIMDVHLPDFNGLDVTKRIREFDKETPIVALTACALPGDKEKALEAGCTGYLTKPIDPNNIDSQVAQFLPQDPSS